ncbi:MAG TPA: hypothetical protein VMR45_02150 [Patescibacteria group bacterium]|nr:hypothetical protein [Patescibacteria group bacterium]
MDEVVVQSGSNGGMKRFFNKRNLIIAGIILIIVGLGIYLVLYFVNRPKNNKTVQSALNNYSDAFSKGDYTGALAALQSATSQSMSNAQKVSLYDSMASAAASSGKLQDALNYYGQKHKLDSSTTKKDAYQMALLYQRLGNKQKAIEQYKIAIAYYKSQKNTASGSNSDLPAMEAQLQSLEAQQ